jgi:hypothetical protein
LIANDIDVFFGEEKEGPFKMIGFPEEKDWEGKKVNLIHVENLSHELLLENNDINATSFAIHCKAMVTDPDDEEKEIIWEPLVHGDEAVDIDIKYEFCATDAFWKWWYDERHVFEACKPQECKAKTFVRLAFKSFQQGYPFLDGGIDPASEILPNSQAKKVKEMGVWPKDESPFQHLSLKRMGGAWRLSVSGNRQKDCIWWPPVIMRDRSIGTKEALTVINEDDCDGKAKDSSSVAKRTAAEATKETLTSVEEV